MAKEQTGQWDGIENPEIDCHKNCQMMLDQGVKARQWKRDGAGASGHPHAKKKQNLDADLMPFIKINSWWTTGLNCKNTRFLDDDVGENLDGLWHGSKFLDTKPKAQSIKKKN